MRVAPAGGLALAHRTDGTHSPYVNPSGWSALSRSLPDEYREQLNLGAWQFAQIRPKDFEVRYVPLDPNVTGNEDSVADAFRRVFFDDASISFRRVTEIAPIASGKYIEYLNEFNGTGGGAVLANSGSSDARLRRWNLARLVASELVRSALGVVRYLRIRCLRSRTNGGEGTRSERGLAHTIKRTGCADARNLAPPARQRALPSGRDQSWLRGGPERPRGRAIAQLSSAHRLGS